MSIQTVQRRIPIIIPTTALVLLTFALTGARTVATATSSPEPSPSPGNSSAPAPANFNLSTFMLIASFVVIATALFFAMKYHRALLEFMTTALAGGTAYAGISGDAYPDEGGAANQAIRRVQAEPAAAQIVGPAIGYSGQELAFVLSTQLFADTQPPKKLLEILWTIDGIKVDGSTQHFLKHTFEKSGPYVVGASAENQSIPPFMISIVASKIAPKTASGLSLPFAIQNWGRMVVLLFGLGVVGALMASKTLSSEAGAGLLGAMLGLGAAAVGSGEASKGNGANGQVPMDDGGATPIVGNDPKKK
ncbi:hypothetical protein [Paeniglutamicibacter terrestris]|uniref:Uncharacterized protein n=1 Tax=Paeniglutamicibacter terrestris TaxID=2723403 RepID=A0ABX1G931_9MICC|nr:hypothetical protein [Paeniglutamicibacter terrestris]NKG22040.1 hypothetical protein [Paeniglutamicibacter terrestris]